MKTSIKEILSEVVQQHDNWIRNSPIREAIEKLKQAEFELEELKQKANTIYKLKCECDKCGHVWIERMEKE